VLSAWDRHQGPQPSRKVA